MSDPTKVAAEALGACNLPCWIVRADLGVDFANPAACHAAGAAPWLRVNDRLQAIGDAGDERLRALVAEANRGQARAAVFAAQRGPGVGLLRGHLHVAPVRITPLYAQAWPRAAALLTIGVPEHDDGDWIHHHVAPRYGLTPAECKVFVALMAGAAPAAIASALGVHLHTVRTHLRALRDKTDRRSQLALVRLGLGR